MLPLFFRERAGFHDGDGGRQNASAAKKGRIGVSSPVLIQNMPKFMAKSDRAARRRPAAAPVSAPGGRPAPDVAVPEPPDEDGDGDPAEVPDVGDINDGTDSTDGDGGDAGAGRR